jgi:hypothetical protein
LKIEKLGIKRMSGSTGGRVAGQALRVPEDRASAVAALMEHLHGSLESIYWEVETASAYVVADLPDSASAAAVIAATTKTGAFRRSMYTRC